MSFKFVTLLLTLSFCLVCVLSSQPSTEHRGDVLFKKYPVHEALNPLLKGSSTQSNSVEEAPVNANAFIRKTHDTISSMKEDHIEQLHNSKTSTTEKKPKWFGYFYKKSRPTLFHNYDAESVVIYGTADAKQLETQFLQDEEYRPILLGHTQRAMMALHVTKYKDSTFGPYSELSVTVHSAKKTEQMLGVSYEEGNDASLLYPLFGKLPDHHRHFVLKTLTTSPAVADYTNSVHGVPSAVATAQVDVAQEDASQVSFRFQDSETNSNIISGKIHKDNTWKSWYETAFQIFRALGLGGIIDLWYAKHVPLKYVTPASQGAKFTEHYTNFKGLSIHALNDFMLEYDSNSEVGRLLRSVDFDARMVTHLPFYQSALGAPQEQHEDMDYLTSRLEFKRVNKEEL